MSVQRKTESFSPRTPSNVSRYRSLLPSPYRVGLGSRDGPSSSGSRYLICSAWRADSTLRVGDSTVQPYGARRLPHGILKDACRKAKKIPPIMFPRPGSRRRRGRSRPRPLARQRNGKTSIRLDLDVPQALARLSTIRGLSRPRPCRHILRAIPTKGLDNHTLPFVCVLIEQYCEVAESHCLLVRYVKAGCKSGQQ